MISRRRNFRVNDCCDKSQQRGAALIVALLVVAMVVMLATALSSDFLVMFRRVENQIYSEQAYAYMRGAEALSRAALLYDLQLDDKNKERNDNLAEDWAQPQQYPTDYGWIGGQLEDLQGRFNLNQLGQPQSQQQSSQQASSQQSSSQQQTQQSIPTQAAQPQLQPPPPGTYTAPQKQLIRLLLALKLEEPLTLDQAEALTDAITDWIDSDDNVSNLSGAESQFYESADPPGRPANRWLVGPSELLLVRGMTPEIYRALLPLVTVWPAGTTGVAATYTINVNTAPLEVLQSLGAPDALDPLSENELSALLDARKAPKFIKDVAELNALLNSGGRNIQIAGLGVSSDYFMLNTITDFQGHRYAMRSILHRGSAGKKQVDVIARSLGDW